MFFLISRACTPEIKAPALQRGRVDSLEETQLFELTLPSLLRKRSLTPTLRRMRGAGLLQCLQ